MSPPTGTSHTDSGKFTAGCGTDKAMHCGHLLLHGDRQAKGGQVKSPTTPAGKIYNKRSVDYNLTQACPKTTITLTTILMKSSTKMMSLATKMRAPSSIWLRSPQAWALVRWTWWLPVSLIFYFDESLSTSIWSHESKTLWLRLLWWASAWNAYDPRGWLILDSYADLQYVGRHHTMTECCKFWEQNEHEQG